MWKINILTLFQNIFPGPLAYSVVGNAFRNGKCSINTYNIRDYSLDKHKTVDDTPYGGGGGMVAKADVLGNAIEKVFQPNSGPVIYMSPRGKLFNQSVARELIQYPEVNFLCCRFEGIDERVINKYSVIELSVGDYILSSGDIALLSVIDTCVRLLEGVLDYDKALKNESFGEDKHYSKLLEYPHYTKPKIWENLPVPNVLLSGNHEEIRKWRFEEAKRKTESARPDLWKKYLEDEDI